MSTKFVSDTAAGKSISAFIILNRRNQHVATVRSHYSNGGRVTVNVINFGDKNPDAGKDMQHGSAGGYGYDKFTAALSGLSIDGHEITNHCGRSRKPTKGAKLFPADAKAPKGWHFANFVYRDSDTREELPKEQQGWSSCYRESGLDYLRAIGYKVIRAI